MKLNVSSPVVVCLFSFLSHHATRSDTLRVHHSPYSHGKEKCLGKTHTHRTLTNFQLVFISRSIPMRQNVLLEYKTHIQYFFSPPFLPLMHIKIYVPRVDIHSFKRERRRKKTSSSIESKLNIYNLVIVFCDRAKKKRITNARNVMQVKTKTTTQIQIYFHRGGHAMHVSFFFFTENIK